MKQWISHCIFPILLLLMGCSEAPQSAKVDPPAEEQAPNPENDVLNVSEKRPELFSKLRPKPTAEALIIGTDSMTSLMIHFDSEAVSVSNPLSCVASPQKDGFWYLARKDGYTYEHWTDEYEDISDTIVQVNAHHAIDIRKSPFQNQSASYSKFEETLPRHNRSYDWEDNEHVDYIVPGFISWTVGGGGYTGGAHGNYYINQFLTGIASKDSLIRESAISSDSLYALLSPQQRTRIYKEIQIRHANEQYMDYIESAFHVNPLSTHPDSQKVYREILEGAEPAEEFTPDHFFLQRDTGHVFLIAMEDWFAPYVASGDYEHNSHSIIGKLDAVPQLFPSYEAPALSMKAIHSEWPEARDFIISPEENLLILVYKGKKHLRLRGLNTETGEELFTAFLQGSKIIQAEWATGANARRWKETAGFEFE